MESIDTRFLVGTGERKLEKAVLGKRDRLNVSYDEMIQGPHLKRTFRTPAVSLLVIFRENSAGQMLRDLSR